MELVETITAIATVCTMVNYLLFRYYNGNVCKLEKRIEKIEKKIDIIVNGQNDQNERISKLEEDVKWLIKLNRR